MILLSNSISSLENCWYESESNCWQNSICTLVCPFNSMDCGLSQQYSCVEALANGIVAYRPDAVMLVTLMHLSAARSVSIAIEEKWGSPANQIIRDSGQTLLIWSTIPARKSGYANRLSSSLASWGYFTMCLRIGHSGDPLARTRTLACLFSRSQSLSPCHWAKSVPNREIREPSFSPLRSKRVSKLKNGTPKRLNECQNCGTRLLGACSSSLLVLKDGKPWSERFVLLVCVHGQN